MGIQEKIDKIRQKPEHIRLRYACAFTAISLFFIIIIWVISLKAQKVETPDPGLNTGEMMNSMTEQKQSLQDAAHEAKGAIDNMRQLENLAK